KAIKSRLNFLRWVIGPLSFDVLDWRLAPMGAAALELKAPATVPDGSRRAAAATFADALHFAETGSPRHACALYRIAEAGLGLYAGEGRSRIVRRCRGGAQRAAPLLRCGG